VGGGDFHGDLGRGGRNKGEREGWLAQKVKKNCQFSNQKPYNESLENWRLVDRLPPKQNGLFISVNWSMEEGEKNGETQDSLLHLRDQMMFAECASLFIHFQSWTFPFFHELWRLHLHGRRTFDSPEAKSTKARQISS
jgi:hypothetical protein